MRFLADFHVHSKYSRATAPDLDFEHLYLAARRKGIQVVGTGDCTHPGWFAEITEKLVPAEPGLFKLKDEIESACNRLFLPAGDGPVRFLLTAEISNIYKKDQKTRKNHNLVFLPDLESARAFNRKLEDIGNIRSDGRPILGLDARNLLEILLETSKEAFLVPAHIWTPWFSLLGSKSGFDSLEECFGDLSAEIFAAETGLSSDPPMNWRVSNLDRLTLISNSDAHSPSKLGREANIFDTELSFPAIRAALRTGDPRCFLGTYEFYPEEGKYHLDGHRKCRVRLRPDETRKHRGICPVCGKTLTHGVLYRVEELADRPPGAAKSTRHPYYSTLPLLEILADIFQVGAQAQKVQQVYRDALQKLGPELDILHRLPLATIGEARIPLLAEAIQRMRENRIRMLPGYDGEYGKLVLFLDEERDLLKGQKGLFRMGRPEMEETAPAAPEIRERIAEKAKPVDGMHGSDGDKPSFRDGTGIAAFGKLNIDQQRAVKHPDTPLLIVAGPGTGKTLTLTHRIAYLITRKNVAPETILAVTFTNKAAREMSDRLKALLRDGVSPPLTATFHAFCLQLLTESKHQIRHGIADDSDRNDITAEALRLVRVEDPHTPGDTPDFVEMIVAAKQRIIGPQDNLENIPLKAGCKVGHFRAVYRAYQELLSIQGVYDFEDLIFEAVRLLEQDETVRERYRRRFPYLFVDEYQDLNHGQYRIVRALAPEDAPVCVIGDPDQSIYGFRGSDVGYFNRFVSDYPTAEVIHLCKNYRSTETILEASHQVIKEQHVSISGSRTHSDISGGKTIGIIEAASDKAEAVAVGKIIEQLVGGTGFHSMDFGNLEGGDLPQHMGFKDIAVLFRTHSQIAVFAELFGKAGIPYQAVGKENLYARRGIRELISFQKIISGTGLYPDLTRSIRILGAGIGKPTCDRFISWCAQNRFTVEEAFVNAVRFPVAGLSNRQQMKIVDFFQFATDVKNRLKDRRPAERLAYLGEQVGPLKAAMETEPGNGEVFQRLLLRAEQLDSDPEWFAHIALQTDTDTYAANSERVALITMHAAKGLEFPVVFLAGCEKGFLPFEKPGEVSDAAEEKRLFYVAMTRARELLFITHAGTRRVFGQWLRREPSPFLADIEPELLCRKKPAVKKQADDKDKQVQLELFS
ncbi:MAG: UvrD-helicase domain-containing protein [Thermodesulfobacteriota bacterium]